MKIVLTLALAMLAAPIVSASDGAWTHTHNYNGWHVPIPGYESRIHPERKA